MSHCVRVSRLLSGCDPVWVREACVAAGGAAANVSDVVMESLVDPVVATVAMGSRQEAEEAANKLDGEKQIVLVCFAMVSNR